MKMKTVKILSNNIHPSRKVDEAKLIDAAQKITQYYLEAVVDKSCLDGLEFESVSFDILYCDSVKSREINREYRGKDKSADVITFALFADSQPKLVLDGEVNLGQIIINVDEENDVFLISHGIMHLLGFDHQTEAEYNFVIGTQEEAIGKI